MRRTYTARVAIFALCCLVFYAGSASASSMYVTYESVYTSNTHPASPITPWLTAFFQDTPDGKVLLTLSAPNLTGTEYVADWYFNFAPQKDVDNLIFTPVTSGYANPVLPVVSKGNQLLDYTDKDGYSGGGLGNNAFRIEIPYSSANNSGSRFTDDKMSQIMISGAGGMTVFSDDFHVSVVKEIQNAIDLEFVSIAHVRSINGDDSAWLRGYDPPPPVPTPEPGTMLLMGAGALVAAFARRRRAAAD